MTNSSPMNFASVRLVRSDEAISQDVGGEVILLNPKTEDFIALNEVGAYVWHLLGEKQHFADLTSGLVGEYKIDQTLAIGDLEEFLPQLVALGLLTCDAGK